MIQDTFTCTFIKLKYNTSKVVHCTYFINYNVLDKICYDDNSYRYEYVIFSDSLRKKYNTIH